MECDSRLEIGCSAIYVLSWVHGQRLGCMLKAQSGEDCEVGDVDCAGYR
jgi:hypothetical protein